ncbi:hypothetical protein BHM03_00023687 [Ensete ventricosum]|uniref:Pectate lyase superfamily protein domain-containing protein n=1 Tax=Ensete ventricosum TaxID=4639 RepID=A0A426ZY63_ENSVE|nr:hypothetical protein B296_00021937 [Ensete ventricosum]RZR94916.1 hypothetical protein BHM03_00023687 [Ensete ventricosum]
MQSTFLRRKMPLLQVLALLAALLSSLPQCRAAEAVATCSGIVPMRWRREVVSITEFGAVGDGKTLNTWSFHKAIYRIQHLRKRGGTLLYIPPGVWLTGSFDLTSHMTLYLARGAVIKATQVSPQYIGTEMNKEDLDRSLFGASEQDLFLISNVVIKHVTVLAPYDSPNTDGIDPDSSSNVCIEDSFVATGDDLVAVKSGWDEYGIAYGRPSSGITVRRLTGSSPFSGIAIGSETSGGVENVLVENINLYDVGIGIHIKTNVGRGGYIRNITISDVNMNNVRKAIRIAGDVGDHPDENFDPNAVPTVDGVTIKNVWGEEVEQPGSIEGIKNSPFTRVCLSNVKLWGVGASPWKCTDVTGAALGVNPGPCPQLTSSFAMTPCSNDF